MPRVPRVAYATLNDNVCRSVQVRGEEGLKIIPQWAYWKQLPGHVYEGCIFSYKHGSRALKNAPRDIQDWYRGRNTKELREPIAYTPAAE
jgi:hypothetical protein